MSDGWARPRTTPRSSGSLSARHYSSSATDGQQGFQAPEFCPPRPLSHHSPFSPQQQSDFLPPAPPSFTPPQTAKQGPTTAIPIQSIGIIPTASFDSMKTPRDVMKTPRSTPITLSSSTMPILPGIYDDSQYELRESGSYPDSPSASGSVISSGTPPSYELQMAGQSDLPGSLPSLSISTMQLNQGLVNSMSQEHFDVSMVPQHPPHHHHHHHQHQHMHEHHQHQHQHQQHQHHHQNHFQSLPQPVEQLQPGVLTSTGSRHRSLSSASVSGPFMNSLSGGVMPSHHMMQQELDYSKPSPSAVVQQASMSSSTANLPDAIFQFSQPWHIRSSSADVALNHVMDLSDSVRMNPLEETRQSEGTRRRLPSGEKKAKTFTVFLLSLDQVKQKTTQRQSGEHILWVDRVSPSELKAPLKAYAKKHPGEPPPNSVPIKRKISLALKLRDGVWFAPLPYEVRVTCSADGTKQSCSISPKQYEPVRYTLDPFLPIMKKLVVEVTNDRNYIEVDYTNDKEVQDELLFHKYLVYPCCCQGKSQFCLCKLTRDKHSFHRLNIVLGWDSGSVTCNTKKVKRYPAFSSFKETLRDFLSDEWPDYLIDSQDVFENQSSDQDELSPKGAQQTMQLPQQSKSLDLNAVLYGGSSPQLQDQKMTMDYRMVVNTLLSLFPASISPFSLKGATVQQLESALRILRSVPHVLSPIMDSGFLEGVVSSCCSLTDMKQTVSFDLCQCFIRVCGEEAMKRICMIIIKHLQLHPECTAVMQLFADVTSIAGFSVGETGPQVELLLAELHSKVLECVFPEGTIFEHLDRKKHSRTSRSHHSARQPEKKMLRPESPEVHHSSRGYDENADSDIVPIRRSVSGHLTRPAPVFSSFNFGATTARPANISPRTRSRLANGESIIIPSLTLPTSAGSPVSSDQLPTDRRHTLPPRLERLGNLAGWHAAAIDAPIMVQYVLCCVPSSRELMAEKKELQLHTAKTVRDTPRSLSSTPVSPVSPLPGPLMRMTPSPVPSEDEQRYKRKPTTFQSNALRIHYHACFLRAMKNILQNTKQHRGFYTVSDVLLSYHDKDHINSPEFKTALLEAMALESKRVDNVYRKEWNVLTDAMSPRELDVFRLDLGHFSRHLTHRLHTERMCGDIQELALTLHIISDYAKLCRTPSLVVHFTRFGGKELFDTITWLTKTPVDTIPRLESLRWALSIIHVFARQTNMWAFIYSLFLLVSTGPVFEAIKNLTLNLFILFKQKDCFAHNLSQEQLLEYRTALMLHFSGVVDMIEHLTSRLSLPSSYGMDPNSFRMMQHQAKNLEENIQQGLVNMAFLYNPNRGVIMEFLNSQEPRKREADDLLQAIDSLLQKCFASKYLTYRSDIQEIAPYYSKYSALFCKQYSTLDSIASLKCSVVILHVVQAFSKEYTSEFVTDMINMKMVDFLTYSIGLEYSIKFEWTRYLPNTETPPFFPTITPSSCSSSTSSSSSPLPATSTPVTKQEAKKASEAKPKSSTRTSAKSTKTGKMILPPLNIAKLSLTTSMSPVLPSKSQHRNGPSPKSSPKIVKEQPVKTDTVVAAQDQPKPAAEEKKPISEEIKEKPKEEEKKSEEGTKEVKKEATKEKKRKKEKKKKTVVSDKKPAIPKLQLTSKVPVLQGVSQQVMHLPSSVAVNEFKPDSDNTDAQPFGSPTSASSTASSRFLSSNRNGLTQLEKKLMLDPKFQVNQRDKPALMTAPLDAQSEAAKQLEKLYRKLRLLIPAYQLQELHVSVIVTLMALMLTKSGTLDDNLSAQFPHENGKLNILFLLHYHLNHPANEEILPELFTSAQKVGQNTLRLLFMLCEKFFEPKLYSKKTKFTEGGFGVIYTADVINMDIRLDLDQPIMRVPKRKVVIKDIPVPKGIYDRCVLHDNFNEIVALERCRDDPRVAHLYTYGVYDDHYWIVMKAYKTSMRKWRKAQKRPLKEMLPLYLNMYSQLLSACHALQDHKIIHFDLKLDNILMDPLTPDISDEEFWNPKTNIPPFYPCLADFGEALVYSDEEQYTTRNRGTEYCKSPEMLKIAYASQKERDFYDRRKKAGCSSASDVWAITLMLYELLTGDYMFYDEDWVRFFMRVTNSAIPILTPQNIEALDHNEHLISFFETVLIRDPIRRPTIRELTSLFEIVKRKIFADLGLPPPPTMQELVCQPVRELGKSEENIGNSLKWVPPQLPIPPEYIDEIKHLNVSDYFLEEPTELHPSLFLGARQCLRNTERLVWDFHITHIVNITNKPISNSGSYFLTLDIDPGTLTTSSFGSWVDSVIGFYRSAIIRNGRVLIVSETSMSIGAAFAIALIMETRMLSYYESFVFLKERRYFIDPHPRLVEMLLQRALILSTAWNIRYFEPSWKLQPRCHVRCICGACCISLFEPVRTASTRRCHCSASAKTGTSTTPLCPFSSMGCLKLIDSQNKRFGTMFTDIIWLHTTRDNLVRPVQLWDSFSNISYRPPDSTWRFYECRVCRNVIGGYNSDNKEVVLVGNFDCSDCLLDKVPLTHFLFN